jgi:hypothetical protein
VLSDRNNAISYFIGVDSAGEFPASILGGDRNVSTNGVAAGCTRLVLTTTNLSGLKPGFTTAMHNNAGNYLVGDGSVEQGTSGRFREVLRRAVTNSPPPEFFLPDVLRETSPDAGPEAPLQRMRLLIP